MGKFFGLALLAMCAFATTGQVSVADAGECCAQPVCCVPPPPPPVEVTWCVVDPCNGCQYQVSACLPACCQCQTPCLADWRSGFLGRKILTYKFPCGECVDVVLTKHGKVSVR